MANILVMVLNIYVNIKLVNFVRIGQLLKLPIRSYQCNSKRLFYEVFLVVFNEVLVIFCKLFPEI